MRKIKKGRERINTDMKKITILGAGAFGFAMAKIISENHINKNIYIYDINKDFIDHIKKTKRHPIFHEGTELHNKIIPTSNLEEAVGDADLIVLAVPSRFIRTAIKEVRPFLRKKVIFVNLAKGLEHNTNERISQVIDEELKYIDIKYYNCCLSGGMIAREVTLQHPLCAELACEDIEIAEKISKIMTSDHLRIETNDDLIGVELAGAFKNVIAIGAGIFDGLGYGESSKSAFVSSAAKQMRELAIKMGAKRQTFDPGSQAWFGDLMTTCFGKTRNREFGELLGKGINPKNALESMKKNNKSVEGYITAEVVHDLIKRYNVKTPLLEGIYQVLYKNLEPKTFVKNFINKW